MTELTKQADLKQGEEDIGKRREKLINQLQIIVNKSRKDDSLEKLSYNKIANKIDVGKSTFSAWRNNRYEGDNERIDRAVAQFIDRWNEKREYSAGETDFVYTKNAQKVFEICKLVRMENDIGAITGNAGVGKTKSLKEYAFGHKGTVMIEVDNSFTKKVTIQELYSKIGGAPIKGCTHEYMKRVINILEDTDRLIIVDEAEHLGVSALNILRRVHDKTKCGLIIAGLPGFISELKSKKRDYTYIYSRIGVSARLHSFNKEDVKKIVQTNIPGSNGIWKTFYEKTQGNGRVLDKLIHRSVRIARINDLDLNKKVVKKAFDLLEV